ncbi:MAG TPA: radical SAM protein [Phycisphaerae bacterium]|nr:radical SAM protein [Phycisphaerae bacterium]
MRVLANSANPFSAKEERSRQLLVNCGMCEWRCGADRTRGESAPCHLGTETFVFNQYLSLTEEPEVRPALRVYLGGCNFRCRFCDTAPECFKPTLGRRVEPALFAAELGAAIAGGAKNISILGGEPTLHVHTLLQLAAASPSPLPMVINTNLYMTPEVIDLLDGVVSLYLGDFKFGNDECAKSLAGVARYVEVIHRNLQLIAGRTPLIVRHLLMPGHLDCCFRPVADWVSEYLPGNRFQLYTGFVPCFRAGADPKISRLNARKEIHEAVEYLGGLNLDWDAGADGHANA